MLLCELTLNSPERREQQRVPMASRVNDREKFIVERCRGKRVVNFGSNEGKLHEMIKEVAATALGVDKDGTPDFKWDLDTCWPPPLGADVYVCGEIIEHLSNPGHFLRGLWHSISSAAEVIITTPNAFSESTCRHMKAGYEVVNPDHVAYYSYSTLKELIKRAGFRLEEFYWYGGGSVPLCDGIIFVVRVA